MQLDAKPLCVGIGVEFGVVLVEVFVLLLALGVVNVEETPTYFEKSVTASLLLSTPQCLNKCLHSNLRRPGTEWSNLHHLTQGSGSTRTACQS
jgi:hypothetical protein